MSLYRAPNGVDLDLIFAARASVTAALTNFRNADGLDLNQRYEGLGSQSPSAPTTNFRNPAGLDLRNVFATTAGVPVNFQPGASTSSNVGPVTATLAFNRDGTITASEEGGTSLWFSVPRADVGDGYDVIFQNQSTPSIGSSWSGTFNTWLQLNTTRRVSIVRNTAGFASGTVVATIRRRSDNVNVASGTLSFSAEFSP